MQLPAALRSIAQLALQASELLADRLQLGAMGPLALQELALFGAGPLLLALQLLTLFHALPQGLPSLGQGLPLTAPQLQLGFGLLQLALLLPPPLVLGFQGRPLAAIDQLQPLFDLGQFLHGGFQLGQPLLGQLQPFCRLLLLALGLGQHRAGLHLAGGGEQLAEFQLQVCFHLPIQGRLQGGTAAPLLQLIEQSIQVVAVAAAGQGIGTRLPLAHPEVGPALGQLGDAAALHRPFHPQQFRQPLLGCGTAEAGAYPIGQLHGATAAGKALAQQPAATLGFKADFHLRQAAVLAGAQFLHPLARGGGFEKQPLVQRLHQGALTRFIGSTHQREAGMKLQLQLAMQAQLAQAQV